MVEESNGNDPLAVFSNSPSDKSDLGVGENNDSISLNQAQESKRSSNERQQNAPSFNRGVGLGLGLDDDDEDTLDTTLKDSSSIMDCEDDVSTVPSSPLSPLPQQGTRFSPLGAEKELSSTDSKLVDVGTQTQRQRKTRRVKKEDRVIETKEYEVDTILDKRIRSGKMEYLVKWKDFSPEESTWEPVEHLDTCQDILKEFNEKWRKKKISKKRGGPGRGYTKKILGTVQKNKNPDESDDEPDTSKFDADASDSEDVEVKEEELNQEKQHEVHAKKLKTS